MNRDPMRRDETVARREAWLEDPVSPQDTAPIDAEIERTRAEMSRTIDEIQKRLSPDTIKGQIMEQVRGQYEEVKESVREATVGRAGHMINTAGDKIGEAGSSLVDTMKENPIPMALIGIGAAWLMMNRGSSGASAMRDLRARRAYGGRDARLEAHMATCPTPHIHMYGGDEFEPEPMAGAEGMSGEGIADRARQAVGEAADTASHYADRAQRTASRMMDEAQHRARRVEDRVSSVVDENPLVLGAMGLAVGAAIGLALPRTRKENELMGETRDGLVERAEQVAERAMRSGERIVDRAAEEAKRAVEKESSNMQGRPDPLRQPPMR